MEIDKDLQLMLNEKMSAHTTFKIGGKARRFFVAQSSRAVLRVLTDCCLQNDKVYFLGGGSNVLFSSQDIDATILHYTANDMYIEGDCLVCSSGVTIGELLRFCVTNSIAGFEFLAGIPGSVGGAVKGNAGVVELAIGDFVTKITGFEVENLNSKINSKLNKKINHKNLLKNKRKLLKNSIKIRKIAINTDKNFFRYRQSKIKNKFFILKIYLKINYGISSNIEYKIKEYLSNKILKQPMQMPSAGSVFLRNKDFVPARAIDELGLKGVQIGGAMVSSMHAGFIVNVGHATSEDVLQLIELIKQRVWNAYHEELHTEIRYFN